MSAKSSESVKCVQVCKFICVCGRPEEKNQEKFQSRILLKMLLQIYSFMFK